MAELLSKIEGDARFFANTNSLDITTAGSQGIRNASMLYRGMATPDYEFLGVKIGRRWPEFSYVNTDTKTVADQEEYAWLTDPVFVEEPFIELLDVSSSNFPYVIDPITNMEAWSEYDDSNSGVPRVYRRLFSGGVVKLALRPIPDTTGDIIRISGLAEATAFTDGESKTAFLNKNSDTALALFIAAFYQQHYGQPAAAAQLIGQGVGLLPRYDYAPTLRPGGFFTPYPV